MSTQILQLDLSSLAFDAEEKELISKIIKQQIQNTVKASKSQLLCHKKIVCKTSDFLQTDRTDFLGYCFVDVDVDSNKMQNKQSIKTLKASIHKTKNHKENTEKNFETFNKKQAA